MRRVAAALLVTSCATTAEAPRTLSTLTAEGVSVEFEAADRGVAQELVEAWPEARARAERFGALRAPVRIRVLPSFEALARESEQTDDPSLRAWARYDEILLQSPRAWSVLDGPTPLAGLLTHELAHCVMYQRSARRTEWRRKQLPVWFKEGFATYVSGVPATSRYRAWREAFARLVESAGEAAVLAMFARMYEGAVFPEAFQAELGRSADEFVRGLDDVR